MTRYFHAFVLFLNVFSKRFSDLIRNVRDVLSSFHGRNAVDETHLHGTNTPLETKPHKNALRVHTC